MRRSVGRTECQIPTQVVQRNRVGRQPTFDAMLASLTISGATDTPTA